MWSRNQFVGILLATLSLAILFPVFGFSQDLVFHYPFSGAAMDISGNGHHGIVSGAILTEDRLGNPEEAYFFDGGDVISVPDSPDFTLGTGDFTLVAWMKITASGGFSYYTMGHDEGPGNTRKWILWISNGSIGIHVNSPSTGGFWISNHGWAAITNEWFHCAVRRDSNNFTIFVNAQPIGSNVDTRSIPDPNTTFTMGDAESQHPERDYRGSLDEVRLYNRALSDVDIDDVYHDIPVATQGVTWGGIKAVFR